MTRHWHDIPEGEREAIVAEARELRAAGMSWNALARYFNLSPDALRYPLDPDYAERRNTMARQGRKRESRGGGVKRFLPGDGPRVSGEELARRLAEIPEDGRSITGRLFGDPLPGRSALDRRQA